MDKIMSLFKNKFTLLILAVPLVVIGIIINYTASGLVVDMYTSFLISLMMVLGFQVFMGNSGILNWVYIGFVGIGAFSSSIMSVPSAVKVMGVQKMYPFLQQIDFPSSMAVLGLQVGPLIGIAVAVLLTTLIAAIFAWPLMRLQNAVGVITQFAALIIIHVILTQWDNVTNGPRTFFGVPKFTTLAIAMVGVVLVLTIVYLFKESRVGLMLRASRDDKYAAMTTGVDVIRSRYLAFVLSAGIAGFAGALWAHYITSFSPSFFYIPEMFILISMLVVGGTGSVTGATFGTIIITILRQGLRQIEANPAVDVPGLTEFSLAALLILILAFRPAGITKGRELSLASMKRFADKLKRKEQ